MPAETMECDRQSLVGLLRQYARAKPGQILISQRVFAKAEHAVAPEPVGELYLKGLHRPISAYNVVDIGSNT